MPRITEPNENKNLKTFEETGRLVGNNMAIIDTSYINMQNVYNVCDPKYKGHYNVYIPERIDTGRTHLNSYRTGPILPDELDSVCDTFSHHGHSDVWYSLFTLHRTAVEGLTMKQLEAGIAKLRAVAGTTEDTRPDRTQVMISTFTAFWAMAPEDQARLLRNVDQAIVVYRADTLLTESSTRTGQKIYILDVDQDHYFVNMDVDIKKPRIKQQEVPLRTSRVNIYQTLVNSVLHTGNYLPVYLNTMQKEPLFDSFIDTVAKHYKTGSVSDKPAAEKTNPHVVTRVKKQLNGSAPTMPKAESNTVTEPSKKGTEIELPPDTAFVHLLKELRDGLHAKETGLGRIAKVLTVFPRIKALQIQFDRTVYAIDEIENAVLAGSIDDLNVEVLSQGAAKAVVFLAELFVNSAPEERSLEDFPWYPTLKALAEKGEEATEKTEPAIDEEQPVRTTRAQKMKSIRPPRR